MAESFPPSGNEPGPPHRQLAAEKGPAPPHCMVPLPEHPKAQFYAHQCSFAVLNLCSSTTTQDPTLSDTENHARLQRWFCTCDTIFCPDCRSVVLDPSTRGKFGGYAWHYKSRELPAPVSEERAAELDKRAETLKNTRDARRANAKAKRRNSGGGSSATTTEGLHASGGRVSKPALSPSPTGSGGSSPAGSRRGSVATPVRRPSLISQAALESLVQKAPEDWKKQEDKDKGV